VVHGIKPPNSSASDLSIIPDEHRPGQILELLTVVIKFYTGFLIEQREFE
jgi:hypothetical protein